MFHVIRRDELPPSPNRTVQFEGEPYRAGISFLLVDNEPGQGQGLHLHPYPGSVSGSGTTAPNSRSATAQSS